MRKWDEAQMRFWEWFRDLPNEQKIEQLRKKVETVLPLQGFTLVWRPARGVALGYEGPFRMRVHWKQWHRYLVEEFQISITYSRLQTPFATTDFQDTPEGQCLAWFPRVYLFGYLSGIRPTNDLYHLLWEWTQKQYTQRNIDRSSWLPVEAHLYDEAFFLQHFGIETIDRVFREEWEDFRAYVTAYEEAHASPNFPPTPPCP